MAQTSPPLLCLSLADLRAKLASDFLPAFLAEVTVWPFVQALNL